MVGCRQAAGHQVVYVYPVPRWRVFRTQEGLAADHQRGQGQSVRAINSRDPQYCPVHLIRLCPVAHGLLCGHPSTSALAARVQRCAFVHQPAGAITVYTRGGNIDESMRVFWQQTQQSRKSAVLCAICWRGRVYHGPPCHGQDQGRTDCIQIEELIIDTQCIQQAKVVGRAGQHGHRTPRQHAMVYQAFSEVAVADNYQWCSRVHEPCGSYIGNGLFFRAL